MTQLKYVTIKTLPSLQQTQQSALKTTDVFTRIASGTSLKMLLFLNWCISSFSFSCLLSFNTILLSEFILLYLLRHGADVTHSLKLKVDLFFLYIKLTVD